MYRESYVSIRLVLKTSICSKLIDILGNNLDKNENFTFASVQLHPQETLGECRKIHPPESTHVEIHKTQHTQTPHMCYDPYPSTSGATTFHQISDNPGFPGGAVVKNPPANAGDVGSSPGLGRSHMRRSN